MVSWFDTVSFSISLLITAIIGVDASHYMSVFMFEHVLRYDYLYRLTDVYCFLFFVFVLLQNAVASCCE